MRLNIWRNDQNWLSLQPRGNHYSDGSSGFGEVNADNKLNGRGILINPSGFIEIGYFDNGGYAPGNYLWIRSDKLVVGEFYKDQTGKLKFKRTRYYNDGRIEQRDD